MESSCTVAFALSADPTISLVLVGLALALVVWRRRMAATT